MLKKFIFSVFIFLPNLQQQVVFVVWFGPVFASGMFVGAAITIVIVELLRRRRRPAPRLGGRGGIRIVDDPGHMLRAYEPGRGEEQERAEPERAEPERFDRQEDGRDRVRPPRPATLYMDAAENFEPIEL